MLDTASEGGADQGLGQPSALISATILGHAPCILPHRSCKIMYIIAMNFIFNHYIFKPFSSSIITVSGWFNVLLDFLKKKICTVVVLVVN